MPSTERTEYTQHTALLAHIEEQVNLIRDDESFIRALNVQARFHRYSWSNAALILAQCPEATQVAGYNAWLRMHRYVMKGQKGIKIFVPMTKMAKNEDGEEESRLVFGIGNVYDISQTDGEPLPKVDVPVLQGEEGQDLYQRLLQVAAAEQLEVRAGDPEKMGKDQMGYYSPRERLIVIKENPMLQKAKTLAHEMGHHLAGHGADGDTSPREEKETAAEAISYITLAHWGLDSGERSFPYIATWARENTLRNALGQIQKVSAVLIDRVEKVEAAELPAAPEPPVKASHSPQEGSSGWFQASFSM